MSSANVTESEHDTEALAEQFFSQPPLAADLEREAWEQEPMSPGNRRAMLVTCSLLGCGVLACLGFAALSDWIVVAPAKLAGVTSEASLSAAWVAPALPQPVKAPAAVSPPPPAPEQPLLAQREPVTAAPTTGAGPATESIEYVSALASARPAVRTPRSEHRTRALGDAPSPESLTQRAYRALAQGRPDEAEQLASRALADDNSRAATYIVLAGARDALGNREGARAAFRACVQRAQDQQVSTCRTLAR